MKIKTTKKCTAAKVVAKKAPAKTAAKKPATAKKAADAVKKVLPKKADVVIQSPLGGEITPEQILAKIGEADKVYVRVDVNKAYWVKGDEAGSVDLW